MGVHLPKLCYYTAAALGVDHSGYRNWCIIYLLVCGQVDVYCCLCPLDPGCPIKAVKPKNLLLLLLILLLLKLMGQILLLLPLCYYCCC